MVTVDAISKIRQTVNWFSLHVWGRPAQTDSMRKLLKQSRYTKDGTLRCAVTNSKLTFTPRQILDPTRIKSFLRDDRCVGIALKDKKRRPNIDNMCITNFNVALTTWHFMPQRSTKVRHSKQYVPSGNTVIKAVANEIRTKVPPKISGIHMPISLETRTLDDRVEIYFLCWIVDLQRASKGKKRLSLQKNVDHRMLAVFRVVVDPYEVHFYSSKPTKLPFGELANFRPSGASTRKVYGIVLSDPTKDIIQITADLVKTHVPKNIEWIFNAGRDKVFR